MNLSIRLAGLGIGLWASEIGRESCPVLIYGPRDGIDGGASPGFGFFYDLFRGRLTAGQPLLIL